MADPLNAMLGATISTDVSELRDTFARLAEAFQHIADGYRRAAETLADAESLPAYIDEIQEFRLP